MVPKTLKGLISAANRASNKTRFGYYPMAPSIGLSEKEIRLHQKALDAHYLVVQELKRLGMSALEHERTMNNHSWVVNKVGNYY